VLLANRWAIPANRGNVQRRIIKELLLDGISGNLGIMSKYSDLTGKKYKKHRNF
jgi:hypothetical protein